MSSRTAHRISLVLGLLVLGIAIYGIGQPAPPTCGGLAKNYPPIIAFELVRSVADLHAIFGDAPGTCRVAIVRAMDSTNVMDSLLFIQAYGAFLIFFFLGRRVAAPRLATAAILIVVLACVADHLENFALFHLSADPDRSTWISLLIPATETKWVGLGIAALLAIPMLQGLARWLAVIACGAGFLVTLATIPAPAIVGPYLSNAVALGWILFLAIDIRESLRRN